MGQVRFVQRGAIEHQLAAGNLVLLTNIGVSSSGELLSCNAFDVSMTPRVVWGAKTGAGSEAWKRPRFTLPCRGCLSAAATGCCCCCSLRQACMPLEPVLLEWSG